MIAAAKPLRRMIEGRRRLAKAAAVLIGLLTLGLGAGAGVDQMLRAARDGIRFQPASGQVHIVEIDARSLRAIDQWPWPRRHHAELIDRLRAAGVHSIAFDVDFSALSTPSDDAALAAALRRAQGSVILPTLRQRETFRSSEFVDNIPPEPFRENAFLASVNIMPDADGYVRQMLLGLETAGVPRPSLAAMVAERQAQAGRSFAVDYAIDPNSIPRHSFIDVIEGRVPVAELAGKRVIVGATAVEIWDRYPVPNHGVMPGVVIQALAAETLLSGPMPASAGGLWPLLLALALVAATVRPGSRPKRALAFMTGSGAILLLPLATEEWLALSFALAPAIAALATGATGAIGLHLAERLRHRSLTDRTTGLPNLAALQAEAAGETVVVARIDRFAALAAGLGVTATANVVHRVVDRLGFGHGRAIYRIDEGSLAWLEPDEEAATLQQRLEGLIALMRAPVDCGRLVDVSLSFGIAGPAPAGADQQVANAALAAVRAARQGRRWERFVEGESEETSWHLSLLGELDAAMAAGRVWNAYQPKLDVASGRIVGVEALVRWDHLERGTIAPDDFIPLLEEHGRARDLTLHVLDRALEDSARWRGRGHDLAVAINVSAGLLLDAHFVGLLRSRLDEASLPAARLTVEVTESAAMNEPERAIAALESWRELGLEISIDDYGTGLSSLAYLQTLPATELKIDKSFVRTVASDSRNAIMVRSTIAMAHELGMKVVAEGVEDAECLAAIAGMGCDVAQGWHIARPMPAAALEALLTRTARRAA